MRKVDDGEKRKKKRKKKRKEKKEKKREKRKEKRKKKKMLFLVATTSLPAVDRPNADRWKAARLCQTYIFSWNWQTIWTRNSMPTGY